MSSGNSFFAAHAEKRKRRRKPAAQADGPVECPACGSLFMRGQGLAAHRRGRACEATLFAREMDERGLVTVRSARLAVQVRRWGIPTVVGPAFVAERPNDAGVKRRRVRDRVWVSGLVKTAWVTLTRTQFEEAAAIGVAELERQGALQTLAETGHAPRRR